ncbi:MAG TPA: DUF3052 domain-containing protein [Actinomycetota bacterium]
MSRPKPPERSSTPLWKKLGVREGSRVLVLGAPQGFSLAEVPRGARMLARSRPPLDVVLLIVTRRADLRRRFDGLVASLAPAGRLWIAWPKKASKVRTDLTFEVVQGLGLAAGLVDNKSASIDQVYQGLQFVRRLADRGA